MSERPTPAPEDLHWGISYLREDIQDLRQQMREDTQETRQETRQAIQDMRQDMRQETQETRQDMRQQIGILHQRIDENNKRIDENNKRMDTHFRWIMTTLIAITGVPHRRHQALIGRAPVELWRAYQPPPAASIWAGPADRRMRA